MPPFAFMSRAGVDEFVMFNCNSGTASILLGRAISKTLIGSLHITMYQEFIEKHYIKYVCTVWLIEWTGERKFLKCGLTYLLRSISTTMIIGSDLNCVLTNTDYTDNFNFNRLSRNCSMCGKLSISKSFIHVTLLM
jgi:hypothetical protein